MVERICKGKKTKISRMAMPMLVSGDQGHLELLGRLGRYLLHLGQATDGKQGDLSHRRAVAHGSEAVGQLVQGDAGEEEYRDHDAEQRSGQPLPGLHAPAVSRPDQDEHEGKVHLHVNSFDAEQFDGPFHAYLLPSATK
jgi:hypothetical protein